MPAFSAQLLATGSCGGVNRTIEAILYIPKYKYAVSCSGAAHSTGGLLVGSVASVADLAGGVDALPPDKLLPGHIVSNNLLNLASSALNPSKITGDAQSTGLVKLGSQTKVLGAVRPNDDPATLPTIALKDYDPAAWPDVESLPTGDYSSQLLIDSTVRQSGDIKVTAGGLKLDGGYLYVDGSLDVQGGVSGTGLIFASGNVSIHGNSSFVSDSVQGIVAMGNVSLDGASGKSNSYFQGLLYTEGDFHAKDITLVGAFVGNRSKSKGGSTFQLDRVNVIETPETISLGFPNPVTAAKGINWPSGGLIDLNRLKAHPKTDMTAFYDAPKDRFDPTLVTAALAPIQIVLVPPTIGPTVVYPDPATPGGGNDPAAQLKAKQDAASSLAAAWMGPPPPEGVAKHCQDQGFSLLETIFSCCVFGFTLMILFNLLPSSMLAVRQAEERLQAENLARSAVEQSRAQAFATLVPGPVYLLDQTLGPVVYHSRLDISALTGADPKHLLVLRATVNWESRGKSTRLIRESWLSSVRP